MAPGMPGRLSNAQTRCAEATFAGGGYIAPPERGMTDGFHPIPSAVGNVRWGARTPGPATPAVWTAPSKGAAREVIARTGRHVVSYRAADV